MKHNNYVLGLDIGIASVGWGIIDADSKEIIDAGVRLFPEGDKDSNAKRRTFRGSRRLTRRRKTRKEDLIKLLKELGIYSNEKVNAHPLELRVKGLTHELTAAELTTALLHINKRRGVSYDTVMDGDDKKEETESKEQLEENIETLKDRHVCEIQLERLEQDGHYRGIRNLFSTNQYEKELDQLLTTQGIKEKDKNQIISLIARKRKYYEGPGSEKSPTPYGRYRIVDGDLQKVDLIEILMGKCSVFPEETRAPALSYTAELFNILNDLNNLTIDRTEKITTEQKEFIIAEILNKQSLTPNRLSKILEVDLESITGFRINAQEKPILTEFKGLKLFKKIFEEHNQLELLNDSELLDDLSVILTRHKMINERYEKIQELNKIDEEGLIDALANSDGFTKTHSLSFKAMRLMIPYLINTDMNQMEILTFSGKFDAVKNQKFHPSKILLDEDKAVLSVVARQSIRQAFKVVNELRRKHGEFKNIVVETTRDKNSGEQQKRIREIQSRNEKQRKEVDETLKNHDVKINEHLALKVRLYNEQHGKTAYSMECINLDTLVNDPFAYEVDHIIPISISLDDSYANKVLVSHRENNEKGNLTPYQAFTRKKFSKGSWTEFEANVHAIYKGRQNQKKRGYLLEMGNFDKYDEEVMKRFINRNLVDTSYAARLVLNTMKDFFDYHEIDTKVHTIKGSATSAFRRKIDFKKKRDEGYDHHAIDALLIASLTHQRNIFKVMKAIDKLDPLVVVDEKTGEVEEIEVVQTDDYFDSSYLRFVKNILMYDVKKFSWKIDRKPNRASSDQTIYSTRKVDGEHRVVKTYDDIYDKNFYHLANDIINEKYENKYLMAIHDLKTFDKLKEIVHHYFERYYGVRDEWEKLYIEEKKTRSGNEYTFKFNPIHLHHEETGEWITKYSKKRNGPKITKIKYVEDRLGSHVDISHNYPVDADQKKVVLLQIKSYRTDFFKDKEGNLKFLTIRYHHVRWSENDQRFVIDEDVYKELMSQKNILTEDDFLFSLHRNELVEIKEKMTKAMFDKLSDEEKEACWNQFKSTERAVTFADISQNLDFPPYRKQIFRFTATNNDRKNVIEVKLLKRYDQKQLMKTIGRNTLDLKKFAMNSIGDYVEIVDEQLKLSFK